MSRVKIDSLVRGKAGSTDRIVEGRVFAIQQSGATAVLDVNGKQWIIYNPEVVDSPRPTMARTDIPQRLAR